MPTDEQRKAIEEVLADRQEAIAAALIEEAETLVPVAVDSTLGELRRRTADKFTRQIVAGITKEQVAAYRAQSRRAGPISSSAWSRPSATAASPSPPGARSSPGSATWPLGTRRDPPHHQRRAARRHASATRSPASSGATSTARSTTPSPQLGRRRRNSGPTPGCDLPEDRGPLSRVHRRRRRQGPARSPGEGRQDLPESIRPPGSANRTAGAPSSTPTTASRKEVPAWKNLTASP